MATSTGPGRDGKIARWGNSLAVRIPAAVASSLKLDDETPVSMAVEDGALVVRPQRPRRSLKDMCKGMTPEKTGGEIDTGEPMGREVW